MQNIGDIRSSFDESLSKIESDTVSANRELKNIAPAESRIKNLDFESESANFSSKGIMKLSAMVLSHSNTSSVNVMRLLG